MTLFLIKLIMAHLIGDFILQPDCLCRRKYSTDFRERVGALALHSATQAVLSSIFLAWWSNWLIPTTIFACHFFIDWIKTNYGKDKLPAFIADQLAHYAVITGIWWLSVFNGAPITGSLLPNSFWLISTAYIAVLAPTSILIKLFIKYECWMPDDISTQGLPNAGKWIGYLERILILTFIFTDNIEGIGFLLAAKSVFRFGELNKAQDIKTTEYVLIGTLTSFAIAILIGFAVLWLNN